jgi:hypothetical protein
MKIEIVPVAKLKEMEGNPRKINEFEFKSLKQNIKEFGYVSPLIVNKDNSVIGGNQRLRALKELGFTQVNVVRLDLPEDKARRLNISLNRISGAWDYDLLNDFLSKVDSGGLNSTGFTEQELKEIRNDYNYDELSKELKDLKLGDMEVVSWTAKFKDEKDFNMVRETLKKVRIANKLGGFKSDYANGRVLKTLAECYESDGENNGEKGNGESNLDDQRDMKVLRTISGSEDEDNAQILKKLCNNYERRHSKKYEKV